MGSSLITNTVTDPSGNPVPSATVAIYLTQGGNISGGFRLSDNTEVASLVTLTASTAGAWSSALENNLNIRPAGTYYTVQEFYSSTQGGSKQWSVISSSSASPQTVAQALLTTAVPWMPITTVPASVFAGNNTWIGTNQFNGTVFFKGGVPWYDVRAFGAVGNGVADDTAAIQTALAQLASGGILFFPAGTYLTTGQFTLSSGNVKLVGAGLGATAITTNRSGGTADYWITLANASSHVSIEGITFTQTGGGGCVGINTNSSTNVSIQNCGFSGPFKQALLVNGGSNVRVQSNYFTGSGVTGTSTPGDAINVFGATDVGVVDNDFVNCNQDATYFGSGCSHSNFVANRVTGSPEGVQVRVNCTHISITGNDFTIKGNNAVNSFGVILQGSTAGQPVTDCTVSANTFKTTPGTANPIAAVSLDNGANRCTVTANTATGDYTDGFSSLPSGTTYSFSGSFVGNEAFGLTGSGIRVGDNGAHWSVTGNTMSGCNIGVLISASNVSASGNTCTANATYGIRENAGGNSVIVANDCTSNLDGSNDIIYSSTTTKVAYNQGRYTAQGSA